MTENWFKLHRKCNQNKFYRNPVAWSIWTEILRRATYKERTVYNKRERIIMKPGQCLVGERELADCFDGISKTTVRYWLHQFVIDRMIDRTTTSKGSVVTVLNWDKYQSIDRPVDHRKTTERPQKDPNKKEKKEKKEKKKNTSPDGDADKQLSFGRDDINQCTAFFEEQLGTPLDDTSRTNRRYCKHILDKMKKAYPDHDPVEVVKTLILAGLEDDFHGKNCTSFKYLYYNAGKIIQARKMRGQQVVNIS